MIQAQIDSRLLVMEMEELTWEQTEETMIWGWAFC